MTNKKKSKKNNRKAAKARPKVNIARSQSQNRPKVVARRNVYVSECARKYWATLSNPFTGPLGCVPGPLPISTFKQRSFSKGIFHSGAAGNGNFGFIIADPLNFACNDQPSVYVTTGGFTNLTISNSVEVLPRYSNSNYTAVELDDAQDGEIEQRVVGFGIRIRYAGTLFNMGGTVTAFQEPSHFTLANLTPDNIQSNVKSKTFPVDNQWVTVLFCPANNTDYDLITATISGFPGSASTSSRFYIGIIVQTAVNSQPFYYEVFAVHEFQGRNVRGQTPTETDPLGLAAAVTVQNNSPPFVVTPEANTASFISRAADYLQSGVTRVNDVINFGKAAVNMANTISTGMSSAGLSGINYDHSRPLSLT